jgi:hypothetical protein
MVHMGYFQALSLWVHVGGSLEHGGRGSQGLQGLLLEHAVCEPQGLPVSKIPPQGLFEHFECGLLELPAPQLFERQELLVHVDERHQLLARCLSGQVLEWIASAEVEPVLSFAAGLKLQGPTVHGVVEPPELLMLESELQEPIAQVQPQGGTGQSSTQHLQPRELLVLEAAQEQTHFATA